MSSEQLCRVGIALLGLYFALTGMLELVSSAQNTLVSSAGSVDLFALVSGASLFALLLGVVPGLLLVSLREPLAKVWFGNDPGEPLKMPARDLLRVGLVLVGVSAFVKGAILIPSAIMIGAISTGDASLLTGALGTLSYGLVAMLLGFLIVRGSDSLTERLLR